MNPEELPLRDIHMPAPVPWWPPAPGWWILGAVLVVAAVVVAWLWYLQSSRARRSANRELRRLSRQYARHHDAVALLQGLSTLMRRAAMTAVDRHEVAGLSGRRWLEWLDGGLEDKPFSQGPGAILADGPYRHPSRLPEDSRLDQLPALCRRRLAELGL